MKARKTWSEKLEDGKDLPRVTKIPVRIFVWIAANAANEERAGRPKVRVTPDWRTLKAGGVLSEKYPGGVWIARNNDLKPKDTAL